MIPVTIKVWCDECQMYTADDTDEHEDRHENIAQNTFRYLRDNDPANEQGDFSGAGGDDDDR